MVPMWDAERIKLASDMWDAGHSAEQISKQLGGVISRNGVIGKMHRLGKSHPLNGVRKERARQLSQIRERRRRDKAETAALREAVKRAQKPPTKPSPSVPYTAIGLSIPFMDLKRGQCHAPMENGQLRCGHKVHTKDYCEAHAALFYRRVG
jgi:hypothetical protein